MTRLICWMRRLAVVTAFVAATACTGGEADGIFSGGGDRASDGSGGGGHSDDTGTGGGDDPGDSDPGDDGGGDGDGDGDGDGEPQCNATDDVRLFLSPDDSNSMSSPVQVRGALELYGDPYAPIRPWEFFNYYSFDYPSAPAGLVELTTELVADSQLAGRFALQIGVSSERVADQQRAPMNLTFVLDTSGSMSGQPIDLLRTVCREIASKLRAGDVISMVTWNTSQNVLLANHEVSGSNDQTLLARIRDIGASGGTDLHAGLQKGYELANNSFSTDRTNRILLISDGGANAGITDIDLIAQNAGGKGEDGIYMVGVGVGREGTYNDELMDSVTDAGKGASVFIDSADEARKIFFTQFVNTMSVAVRDVQVQLDLPAGFDIVKFSGEEVSTDPTEIEPQHLAPNDAMVFHQEIETCAPELVDDSATLSVTVRYKDAVTFEQRELAKTYRFAELVGAASPRLLKGAAILRFTEALTAKRKGEDASAAVTAAADAIETARVALPEDLDLAEISRQLDLMNH